jgi:hypothetical protein
MPFNTEASEQMVCAVLAAQVAVLRERIDTGATVELLWRASDVLSQMSRLVLELAKRSGDSDADLRERCDMTIAAEADVSRLLESLAFEQAQRNDFTCQTVDCVVTALERLAVPALPAGVRLSPGDLAALYVSEDQRQVHEAATRKFVIASSLGRSASEGGSSEGPGK